MMTRKDFILLGIPFLALGIFELYASIASNPEYALRPLLFSMAIGFLTAASVLFSIGFIRGRRQKFAIK